MSNSHPTYVQLHGNRVEVQHRPGKTSQVFINGVEVCEVRGIHVELAADNVTVAAIKFPVTSLQGIDFNGRT